MMLLLLVIYDQQHRQQQHLNIYDVVVVGNLQPTTKHRKLRDYQNSQEMIAFDKHDGCLCLCLKSTRVPTK